MTAGKVLDSYITTKNTLTSSVTPNGPVKRRASSASVLNRGLDLSPPICARLH